MTLGHFLSSEYDDIVPLAGGSGGQGTVFKARHREFDQLRAVKWLHGTIESDSVDRGQPNKTSRLYEVFIREARNLMQLNTAYQPNIVRIYNARLIQHHSLWFPILEMELIEGTDLNTLIEQGGSVGLPLDRVESLLTQLASALAHCHRFQVIHRDVKSHNVMWDSGAAKFVLVDFGLSLLAGEPVSQERRGTPQYMSPEQYEGLDPSPQSDIYSLGVVIYEALTGQLPFGPETSTDHWRFYSYAHLQASIVPIRSLRSDVPTWLEEVVGLCLAKDPGVRFANGEALMTYLATTSGSTPSPPLTPLPGPIPGLTLPAPEWARRGQRSPQVETRNTPPPGGQPSPSAKRGRWGKRALGIVFLLVGLLVGLYWLSGNDTSLFSSGSSADDAMKQAQVLQGSGQYSQAAEIYQRLIDEGEPSAYKPLFRLYMGGHIGGEDRCQKAFGLLQGAADANDYQACNLLGYVYEYGEYVNRETGAVICRYEPDARRAFHYVQKAAVGGNAEAMRQVATYYQRGFGTSVDEPEAARWRRKAREASQAN